MPRRITEKVRPMIAQTALLVCNNPTIIEAVHSVSRAAPALQLQRCADFEEAWPRLAERALGLLIVHLPAAPEESATAQLAERLQASSDSCPIIILADNYRAREAAALVRAGAAEYLGSPFDFAKLADYMRAAVKRSPAPPALVARRPASWGSLGEDPFFYV